MGCSPFTKSILFRSYASKIKTTHHIFYVAMMKNSVLCASGFKLLFFNQRQTSWRQSLSWFRERQVSDVATEMQICVICIKVTI